ncbi:TD and POZ domain-containing protein 4 [Hordeum vulgare]|nr:TD and POZ domain-containing protein 4 [Hordeum vulgare]
MSNPFVSTAGATRRLSASTIVAPVVGSGSHVLRVEGYSHTKGLGNGKFVASESFTVGGHQWCLQYYPDSSTSDNSDSVTISLNLVSRNLDFVQATYTISLLDKEGNPSPSCTCTFRRRTFTIGKQAPSGFDLVIRRRDLEESGYLKGDVFSVACDVTVVKKITTKAIPVSEARRWFLKQEK